MGIKKMFVLVPVALVALVGYGLRGDVACLVALAKVAGRVLYLTVSVLGC